jgi:hypothetical protein
MELPGLTPPAGRGKDQNSILGNVPGFPQEGHVYAPADISAGVNSSSSPHDAQVTAIGSPSMLVVS